MCAQPPGFKALQEVIDREEYPIFRTLGEDHYTEWPVTNKWPRPVWARQWIDWSARDRINLCSYEQGSWDENAQAIVGVGGAEQQPLLRVDILGQGQMENTAETQQASAVPRAKERPCQQERAITISTGPS